MILLTAAWFCQLQHVFADCSIVLPTGSMNGGCHTPLPLATALPFMCIPFWFLITFSILMHMLAIKATQKERWTDRQVYRQTDRQTVKMRLQSCLTWYKMKGTNLEALCILFWFLRTFSILMLAIKAPLKDLRQMDRQTSLQTDRPTDKIKLQSRLTWFKMEWAHLWTFMCIHTLKVCPSWCW